MKTLRNLLLVTSLCCMAIALATSWATFNIKSHLPGRAIPDNPADKVSSVAKDNEKHGESELPLPRVNAVRYNYTPEEEAVFNSNDLTAGRCVYTACILCVIGLVIWGGEAIWLSIKVHCAKPKRMVLTDHEVWKLEYACRQCNRAIDEAIKESQERNLKRPVIDAESLPAFLQMLVARRALDVDDAEVLAKYVSEISFVNGHLQSTEAERRRNAFLKIPAVA